MTYERFILIGFLSVIVLAGIVHITSTPPKPPSAEQLQRQHEVSRLYAVDSCTERNSKRFYHPGLTSESDSLYLARIACENEYPKR